MAHAWTAKPGRAEMIDRRLLLRGAAGLSGGLMLPGAASADQPTSYDETVEIQRRPLRIDGGANELVRYATLAANSHNTQPWTFKVDTSSITIAPDYGRKCPAVDPNDHHLFVSLGCAAENLVHAAAAAGLRASPVFLQDAVSIALEPAPPSRSVLFDAIPRRQCTRAVYDGKTIATESLRTLEQAGAGNGVTMLLITETAAIASVIDYVIEGNSAQMRDKAFMAELTQWIRFNEAEAVAKMDGLSTRATGNPSMPSWLGRRLLSLVLSERSENDKYRAQIQSSAGAAIFVADHDDKAHWVEAGRACQRFALQATALGLKYAFVNQPIEVAMLRRQFATHLGIGDRMPDLIVRFGHGPELPKSLRRPVEQVMS